MIGAWMLYSVVVGACAVAAALALEPVVVARGGARRGPWVAALAVALLVPLAVAIRPAAMPSFIPSSGAPLRADRIGTATLPAAFTLDWDRWLTIGWGVASLAMLVALCASALQLWRAGRRARAIVLDGTRVALTADTGPGALWFGATRIMLPEWLVSLDAPRRALLVRHEDEHVRAGDPHLLVASLASLALMPWNPALWFIAGRLRVAMELDCDARVLAAGADVHTYGELLLTVASARRPPRLAAYLAFAASPSPLERRIRAMTSTRPALGTMRQLSLGLVALAAVVTACETRRPDPVAPVTSYTVAGGEVTAARTPTGAQADSVRSRMSTEVRERVAAPTLNGNPNDPLVMIYDAEGTVVLTGRLGAKDAQGRLMIDSLPVPANEIASVDVIKNAALLPPEAKGGLIKVVLKPGSAAKMRQPMPESTSGGAVRERRAESAVKELLVIIMSNDGTPLYRELIPTPNGAGNGDPLAKLPVDPSAIATVNVVKPLGATSSQRAELHVTLKAGQGLKAQR